MSLNTLYKRISLDIFINTVDNFEDGGMVIWIQKTPPVNFLAIIR